MERYLRADPVLHAYGLGDLDEYFRPHTTWYADDAEDPQALILRYQPGNASPVYHALGGPETAAAFARLLLKLRPTFPDDFEVHISPAIHVRAAEQKLFRDFHISRRELHHKMEWRPPEKDREEGGMDSKLAGAGLANSSRSDSGHAVTFQISVATRADRADLERLYQEAYSENWFDPRMLATGVYLIARAGNHLAGVAGVHVYSEAYRVAALGNITTHPDFRRQGVARLLTEQLCELLRRNGIETITLNVKAFNKAAISCYAPLGFRFYADYEELSLTRPDP
ncbi:MAG: GNAT family N-acetyltransferase [Leptospirales bacterium]